MLVPIDQRGFESVLMDRQRRHSVASCVEVVQQPMWYARGYGKRVRVVRTRCSCNHISFSLQLALFSGSIIPGVVSSGGVK